MLRKLERIREWVKAIRAIKGSCSVSWENGEMIIQVLLGDNVV